MARAAARGGPSDWVKVGNPVPAWMSAKAASCLNTRKFNKEVDQPSGGVAGGKWGFRGPEPTVTTLLAAIPVAISHGLKFFIGIEFAMIIE